MFTAELMTHGHISYLIFWRVADLSINHRKEEKKHQKRLRKIYFVRVSSVLFSVFLK